MADNIQVPTDLTKLFEIKVEDKSDILRRFLIALLNKVNQLETRVKALEEQSGP